MKLHKALFSAWNKWGTNPFPGEHNRRWRDGQSFSGTLDFFRRLHLQTSVFPWASCLVPTLNIHHQNEREHPLPDLLGRRLISAWEVEQIWE